jgi:ABC-type Fe3+/spermidine/putrescine transport system ATPase subunit
MDQRETNERESEATTLSMAPASFEVHGGDPVGVVVPGRLHGRAIVELDAQMRVQARTDIAKLQAGLGVTTVYAAHDQVEAMTMGDRVAVMKDGYLQQVDTPLDLYDRPVNLFVAGFTGSPQMNLMGAVAQRGRGRKRHGAQGRGIHVTTDGRSQRRAAVVVLMTALSACGASGVARARSVTAKGSNRSREGASPRDRVHGTALPTAVGRRAVRHASQS